MWRWFKQNVLFVSLSKWGLFVYVHCLPTYTYNLSLRWERRAKPGSKPYIQQQTKWAAATAEQDFRKSETST